MTYELHNGIDKQIKERLGPGFVFGYQKTLFRNAYIDMNGAQSWNLLKVQPNDSKSLLLVRIDFGLVL